MPPPRSIGTTLSVPPRIVTPSTTTRSNSPNAVPPISISNVPLLSVRSPITCVRPGLWPGAIVPPLFTRSKPTVSALQHAAREVERAAGAL